jgi:PAS domain S-box-containing protein
VKDRRELPFIAFAITLVALIGGGLVGTMNARRLITNDRTVTHTDDAIVQLGLVLSTLQDAETGQRGYLLTENDSYLVPYQDATAHIQRVVTQLRDLLADPAQQARLDVLEQDVALKLSELARTIALDKAGDHAGAIAMVRGNNGKLYMDRARTQIAAMQTTEYELLNRLAAESERSARMTIVSIILTALIGSALLLTAFSLTRRNMRLRQRAADQLAAERERLRVTLASIGDAVLTTDAEARISFANPVAESLTGWSQQEMAGHSLESVFRIVNEQTRQMAANPALRSLREGVIVGLANHTVLIRKDGSELPIDDSAAPILDERGSIIGCVLVFRDITQRRQEERRLADSEAQAYQMMIELKEGDRRKDEFLALLAHELRGPLAPLRNGLELLKRSDGNQLLLRQVRESMQRQLDQLVRLVNDLIDVNRIARNMIDLRSESVDLAEVIRQAVETFRPLCESRRHEVSVRLPAAPMYIEADSARLAQVFGNILHNACKFTERGGRVEVSATLEDDEAVVQFKDTGVGIPSSELSRIFEMFTQVDRSLERTNSGLGIGLSLVKRLVEMHGGSVEAFSDGPGRGSAFVVRLPVAVAGSRAAPIKQSAPEPELPRRRILIVDDNTDSASSLAMLLQVSGQETYTAHDGAEALKAAERVRPDVVLLDVGLPKLNGYEVCRQLRQQDWAKRIVIVAVTGWGQDEDRERSKEAGFDAHMIKPPDYAALMELIAARPAEETS